MSETTALAPKDLTEVQTLSKTLASSALLPMALRKKPEDVLAIVLAGAELGLAPMQSIRAINIIEGKLSMAADLMGAQVLTKPVCEYLMCVETTDKQATYETKRRGSPSAQSLTFTIDQARRAGLLGKANWKNYPEAMLRARAEAAICRMVYPDLCLGIYDPDEIDVTPKVEGVPEDMPGGAPSMAAHVEQVKSQLRSQVAPTDIVDAEIVEPETKPAEVHRFEKDSNGNVKQLPKELCEALDLIANTKTLDELQALIPKLQTYAQEIRDGFRQAFIERRQALAQ